MDRNVLKKLWDKIAYMNLKELNDYIIDEYEEDKGDEDGREQVDKNK